jgi:dienelactone hydrolase
VAKLDPFARGPFAVGVRTEHLVRDERPLPTEVWYPAQSFGLDTSPLTQDHFTVLPGAPPQRQAAVRDAPPQPGAYPLVLFSHTSLGHRRQSTFLCTHLASHGFVVAALDHTGNTFVDLVERQRAGTVLTSEQRDALIERIVADRVPDLRFLADWLLNQGNQWSALIDARNGLGLVGWSFGGWAALATPEVDARFGAIVALAPGGASNPLPGIIPAQLTFAWRTDAKTLYLVAERDRYTVLEGMHELFGRTPGQKRMFILRFADHDHFGDHFEPQLVARQQAHTFTRSLAVAHLRATLSDDRAAEHFLAHEALAELTAHAVPVLGHI